MTFIGKIIRQIRESKKLSRDDLAKLSGVSRSSIQRYETTDAIPNYKMFSKLLKALDLTDDDYQKFMGFYNGLVFENDDLMSEVEKKRHYIDLVKTLSFDQLNSDGCKKVYEYVNDISANSKYQNYDGHTGIINGEELEKETENITDKE